MSNNLAAGRVATGFSKPYVARYSNNGGAIKYSGARQLARGVEVTLSPESSDDNTFYADNQAAENAGGVFTGGEVSLTVDGLFTASKQFIFGLPDADADGWTPVGDSASTPYIGIGYITRYMSGGVTSYVPTILCKTKFSLPEESASTQEDEIDWQTQELTATLMRDDSSNHNWKFEGASFDTETEAEAALVKKLGGITAKINGVTIGSLTLTPSFNADVTEYTAETSNATNTVTVSADSNVSVAITVNGTAIDNGTAATWNDGENALVITASGTGMTATEYKVAVTKSE